MKYLFLEIGKKMESRMWVMICLSLGLLVLAVASNVVDNSGNRNSSSRHKQQKSGLQRGGDDVTGQKSKNSPLQSKYNNQIEHLLNL